MSLLGPSQASRRPVSVETALGFTDMSANLSQKRSISRRVGGYGPAPRCATARAVAGASPVGARVCFIGFTAARVLHAIAYLNALQPWRTIFYALGAFALTGMMVLILVAVSS